ncbi:hypothetical protein GIB67_018226 [Kingdonia uniflora]|uniref:GPI transamidase component PIG-T n=1 Tax=Kingdonia uniflora TaxID=39325 RepID=A0A7J7NMM0_9MAGN|nr:hypothetical protein GIB67_018226 [Kingdonia uniflora]
MAFLRLIQFFTLLVLFCLNGSKGDEEFSEELLLRPLPDRKVLAHFHFENKVPSAETHGRHYSLFPKAIYQLVEKFQIREMELSFTQGRWNYETWGGFDPVSSSNAKPPGVELWAIFNVPLDQVDVTWKSLTHALSGLFCASVNFLESTTTYSAPTSGFPPYADNLRYGALPREAVCTENLTPWLKLLPCRDKAGLASLLDRPSIYRGFYHSQRLRLVSTELGIKLEQTLTIVLQPGYKSSSKLLQPSWSISSIFGRKVSGKCALAKTSTIFFALDRALVFELNKLGVKSEKIGVEAASNPAFELSVIPDKVIKEVNSSSSESLSILYGFSLDSSYDILDIGLTWKLPVVWSSPQAPFHATRFLTGSGNERGSIVILLRSTEYSAGVMGGNAAGDGCKLQVVIFQAVPWYVKLYFHTLQVVIDGRLEIVTEVVEKIRVAPSEDRVSLGVMEMVMRLPCSVKTAALTIEFDKGFLHIDDYPPDANQGFDIPSAVISFPDTDTSTYYLEENTTCSSLLLKFQLPGNVTQEKNTVLSYTEVLLVPLATPDFSMPYNVITITCTVFALYFGSLLNVLRRRVGEEERFLKAKAGRKIPLVPLLLNKLLAKLRGRPYEPTKSSSPSSPSSSSKKLILKVILVAGVAVGWHYYYG